MRFSKSFEALTQLDQKLLYMINVKPVVNYDAMFSDATRFYRSPEEPMEYETVTIRFRTAKYNADSVILIADGEEYPMTRFLQDELFDYYEARIHLTDKKVRYYFRVKSGKVICYYNQWGAIKELNEAYNFEIIPGFKTPNWAKGAVVYQIYVDRFCNGDKSNDVTDGEYVYIGAPVKAVTDWNRLPEAMDVRDFYGGDLQGVMDKLDYLSDLGVDVIYFNPLFVSPSNHKYDIEDYDYIDPHIGVIVEDSKEDRYRTRVTSKKNLEASNQLFIKIVQEIHARGMRVIIDGVFNHCGSFNKWLDREYIYDSSEDFKKGAFVDKDSPYRNYFSFADNRDDAWPNNGSYEGWWGHDTLPKLNYENSKELEDYVIGIGRKWVSPPFNADGWRLDVAADLGHSSEYNHEFWRKFRRAVKEANPEAIIMAEHYGNASSWLQGDQWDTIMNYDAFMEPVTWFLTGMEKHSDSRNDSLYGNGRSFFDSMKHNMATIGAQSIAIALNQLSNHDHSRFLTRTNRKVGRIGTLGSKAASEDINYGIFKEAVVIQMTWPGAPGIYYGDEAGLCGFTDPDNRRTYPWGNENKELIELHKEAINLRKRHKALLRGSVKELVCGYNIISYGRFLEEDILIVVVNNNDEEKNVRIPVWEVGLTAEDDVVQVLMTTEREHSTAHLGYSLPKGELNVMLRPYSAVVFKKID